MIYYVIKWIEKEREKNIAINGHMYAVKGSKISYQKVVTIVTSKKCTQETHTVIWNFGHDSKASGILHYGEVVPIKVGMNFNCQVTGNA